MSTLPGQASKGEKTKSKYQSLDINNLYRSSRGENLEKQQQKSSSSYIKHGMQLLGKVPNARRPPANLPSLKAEHSGTDTAVPLVPPGAPGWGKQDSTTSQPNTPSTQTPSTNSTTPTNVNQQPSVQMSSHQAAIALPVTTPIPPHNKQMTPSAQTAPADKLWSSVMSGQDIPHPPLYQSPQFQHEFPSLSAGDGGPTRTGSDAPYPSGLSLRPQTEGSWTQGGQRPIGGENTGPPRPGSAPLGAPPQLTAQVGLPPQQQFPPQIRGVMPPFMYKGSNFQQGSGAGIQNQNTQSPVNGRGGRPDNRPPRLADREPEEITPRPIIKEEELSRMDEIGKDMGWAESDEIDYNQKLAFSDDESEKHMKKESRRSQQMRESSKEQDRMDRNDTHINDNQQRQWSSSRSSTSRGRSSEEEDMWMQRRNQTDKEMEIVVQRAKQRKEEEEKRFNEERKQGAAKKLMELEEKIQKRDRDNHEGVGTINPSSVPPKPINHVDIPLPEFQKEKERDRDLPRERDGRSRTPNELIEDKSLSSNQGSSFRHLTQIEGKNFPRKNQKPSDREPRDRDRGGCEQNGPPNFSRQFQSDLPPRFLKHQRNNSNSNLQNQQQYNQFDNRWTPISPNLSKITLVHNMPYNRNIRQDSPEIYTVEREGDDENRDYKRQSSEDSYRSSHHSQQEITQKTIENRYEEIQESHHQNYEQYNRREKEEDKWQKDRQEDKWQKDKDRQDKKQDDFSVRQQSEDWNERNRDEKITERIERERDRPQRPDSRDSRSTRHSRDSEQRDYMGSWSESAYEQPYEEKRREHIREDRRVVPGPITKERIEADDMRNEKRNLTQLKRGQIVDVKPEQKKEEKDELDTKKEPQISNAWADAINPALEENESAKFMEEKKILDSQKSDVKQFNDQTKKTEKLDDYNKDRGHSRNRQYSQNKVWNNGASDYHTTRTSGWQKRPPSRGHKSGRLHHGGEFHGTDSDGSMDDHAADAREHKVEQRGDQKNDFQHDQRSPKPIKKIEKDEKNRENKQEKFVSDQKKSEKPEKRDNYVPRGEPSRHGRGGGNFRSGRMGGLSKRIDGYGPPPLKSPFSHHDDKEKKTPTEETLAEGSALTEDKTKQNQQALAAGIIGKTKMDTADDKNKGRIKVDSRKSKPKGKDDMCDTNSEHSDDKDKRDGRKLPGKTQVSRSQQNINRSRNNPPPRMVGDKRSYDTNRVENVLRSNSMNTLKKEDKPADTQQNVLANAIADISLKNRDDNDPMEEKEEKGSINGDSEGFQEVKSKKAVKERQRSAEDKHLKSAPKSDPNKDILKIERDRKSKSSVTQQLTQQQIQNIPSLMATPVNPPPVLPQPKNQFERPRQSKLAPRFAKQKLQKAQMQQQHNICDVNDLSKVGQNINVYGIKDGAGAPLPVSTCAWDKPLGSQLRNIDDGMLGVAIEGVKGLDQTQSPTQGASPNTEKMLGKPPSLQDKTLLDGSTPPVNTIIFENTNFKSAPGSRNSRADKPRSKLEEGGIDNSVISGFNKPTMNELLQTKTDKSEPIQLPLFKEDTADMKLDFFGPDLQFTDEKTSKNLCMTKTIHTITSGNNTVDSLDIKIASVKKVWETSEQESEDNQISFGGPPLDSNVFNQGKDTPDDNHEGYSPSPNQTASTTTNVCKVKPTQQVSGSGQTVLSSTSHQQHSGIVAPGLMGNPLSPPPMQPVLGASVGIGPQQYTANQHIGYQASLSGSTQFGMSAIPSPPTVPLVYNSTQQLQAAAQTAGLYAPFQIEQAGVLGGQGRSQYSQYPSYHGLGQTASSPYSTQSVYLQTAPPHPPPTAQAPPELYPNMNNYRLSATAPFGQSQQLNNPTTVLISSTSNSLMSASVKPSSQQISAIGTKAGGVGQAYQQQSQQGQQVYMTYDPSIQANYLPPSAGVMQRGPAGPVQNNVVPGLQPSSSYYSGSTGGQTGYFQQPGNSTMNSAQLQQHQASFGLQGNVFGTHSQSHTNTGLQNFNSHFLTAPMQVAAAISAQQFRSAGLPAAYMKGVGSQQIGDQSTRPQQLKSPSSQEVLSSVFNSGPQIPSPKSRQNCKHPPPQSSPTAQHKYNLYQAVGGQQNPNIQRYPTPIQRPVNFQQMQQNSVNQKHRNNPNNKTPNRQYYGGQNSSLSSQNEKTDDSKINDSVTMSSANSANNANKTAIGTSSAASVNVSAEKVKENIKEETAALKD